MPLKFLGVHVFKGVYKRDYLDHLIENLTGKMDGWRSKLLNLASKTILVQDVLNSTAIHLLSVLNPKNSMCNLIQSKITCFLWDSLEVKDIIGVPRIRFINQKLFVVLGLILSMLL